MAKVVTSIVAGDCVRSGRKTTSSIASEKPTTTAKQATMLAAIGQSLGQGERERAGHDQLAVGEVDEPHHAEDETDSDGDERVRSSRADGVDERLDERVEDEAVTRGTRRSSARCRRRPPASGSCATRRSRAHTCGPRTRPFAVRAARRAAPSRRVSRISRERLEDDIDDLRREPERRLVEEQHVGPGDERSRDRELLLLAARERARLPAPDLGHDGNSS